MQYRELGKSGIRISVVGLGTWAIGGWAWGGNDDNDSIAAIRRGLDDGINLIDTAPTSSSRKRSLVKWTGSSRSWEP